MVPRDTHKILLITLSNIGDAVMTTPVLEALHRRYPQAVIDIVTRCTRQSAVHALPVPRHVLNKDKQAGWRGTATLVRQLRNTHYDLVVDLRTDGLTLLLRARARLTRRKARHLRLPCGRATFWRHCSSPRQPRHSGGRTLAVRGRTGVRAAAAFRLARTPLAGTGTRRTLATQMLARTELPFAG